MIDVIKCRLLLQDCDLVCIVPLAVSDDDHDDDDRDDGVLL